MDFWDRVDYVRERQSLSWKALAKRAGHSYNTLNGWRSKKRTPNVYEGAALAKALDTSLDYLVTGRVVEAFDDPDLEDMCNMLRGFSRDELMMAKGMLLTMQYSSLRPKTGEERGPEKRNA